MKDFIIQCSLLEDTPGKELARSLIYSQYRWILT